MSRTALVRCRLVASWVAASAVIACVGNSNPQLRRGEIPRIVSGTIGERHPDSLSATGCFLGWKTVLGDSTVAVATLDLGRLSALPVVPQHTTVARHLLGAVPGYAVALETPQGAFRESFRGALRTITDSIGQIAVVAAVVDSNVAQAFADRVNVAIRGCRVRVPSAAD